MHFRPPKYFIRKAPFVHWYMPDDKYVYLTFDDGPSPEVTPWILDELDKYNVKATFFCIGKNAELHPELIEDILKRGHSIGNHTYSHSKSLIQNCEQYIEDIDMANEFLNTNIMRPPYGRLSLAQLHRITERFHIIMMDIISRDYSKRCSPEHCLRNVTEHVKGGSIVGMHDSLKAKENITYLLPRLLEFLKEKGLECRSINL